MAAGAGNPKQHDRGAQARRHNHALVAMGRRVWSEDCTLESAIALICEIAADTLEIERVNVWRCDHERNRLHCIHSYERSRRRQQGEQDKKQAHRNLPFGEDTNAGAARGKAQTKPRFQVLGL